PRRRGRAGSPRATGSRSSRRTAVCARGRGSTPISIRGWWWASTAGGRAAPTSARPATTRSGPRAPTSTCSSAPPRATRSAAPRRCAHASARSGSRRPSSRPADACPVMDPEHPQQPFAPLLHGAFGGQTAQILYVAAKLGLADRLRDDHRTVAELGPALGVDGGALLRVLRGLVSLAVRAEIEGGRFGLTALGEYLRADHPDSVQPRVILNGEVHGALWADLLATVETGGSASQRVFGMPFYDYLARHPAAGSLFDRAMTSAGWVRYRFRPLIEAYDFGQFRPIVDDGGSTGTRLVELLKTYHRPTGRVFDLPRLAEAARQTIGSAGLTARCQFLGGDAFEAVPAGADAYLLSNFV